ncbi:unnamed protein product [Leptosia nina]|uniref:Uncharacterized protein n=1 Tax=Leptosia nina TaxID=320188 RepID=A0AAV1JJZ7_9NEOP
MPPGTGHMPASFSAYANGLNEANLIANSALTNGYIQNNYNNAVIASEALNEIALNANRNSILTNELNSMNYANNLQATPVQNPAINNIQVSPIISEVVPSLQYGDVNMAGELPIGGTIKVSGCFPVYGMIAVDGNVPSSGTAVVAESFGNQVMDVVSKCASQYFS